MLAVAEKLGKFAWEVNEQMPWAELLEWGEWFRMQNEAQERAMQEARTKSKRR